ncbi:MAG: LTA synthase family protein [Cocleimonas sp.]|nr:LTA synthase family protein [Cocleimonas sp.]
MLTFIFALFFTITASIWLERFSKPKEATFSNNTLILQASIISILFIVLTLIVQRPIFSGIALVVFFIIVIAVSNAKFKALKEPIVFSDFAMFSQAFKHPRLYFPFLGLAPVIIAPIIIIGLIIAVLTLEPAMAFTAKRIFLSLLAIIGIGFFIKNSAEKLKLSANPAEDNARYGLINTLVTYTVQARSKEHKQQIVQTLQSSPFFTQNKNTESTPPHFYMMDSDFNKGLSDKDKDKPNITVIQSESFFDARRLHPSIKTDILKNFDACNAESAQYGKLKVPAWGANTMRSEFSFLTGLKYQDMGLYRYYPYQFIHQMPVSSIASALQSQGYYCVCIHPHPASFFGRDKLFPKLGFDEFIDIGSFDGATKSGPYISDQAVTDKILEITKQITDKPLFIFAITMENHGPLHLEKTNKQEQSTYYSDTKLGGLNDLTVYLRHLKNADKMIKALTDNYRQSSRETTLCFYGDHIPSMPDIYQKTDYNDDHSDYFIWHSKPANSCAQTNMSIESLANKLLDYSKV